MSATEIDTYLDQLDEPKRSTLETLRRTILRIIPDAEEGLSYGVPVFRIGGKNAAGFSAAKAHLSYLPHSGTVTTVLADELLGYATSRGALKFPVDAAPPEPIVRLLVDARRAELNLGAG